MSVRTGLLLVCLSLAPFSARATAQVAPADAAVAPPEDAGASSEVSVEAAIDVATVALNRLETELLGTEQRRAFLQTAADAITVIREKDPTNATLLYLSGWANALAGRSRQAIDELRAFIGTRDGRNEWRAYRLLGDLLVDQYPQLAKSRYDNALTLSGGDRRVFFGLALCASRRGRHADAVDYARRAVEADGRKTVGYLALLAQALAADKQWDAAEREGAAALSLAREVAVADPGSTVALTQLDGRYRFMIQLLQARTAGDDATADDYIRLVDYRRQHLEVATDLMRLDMLRTYEAALDKLGDNVAPRLLEAFGVACAEAKNRARAIEVFERLLAVDSESTVAREWLARLKGEEEPSKTPSP